MMFNTLDFRTFGNQLSFFPLAIQIWITLPDIPVVVLKLDAFKEENSTADKIQMASRL